jgi:hypothetical protein
MAELAPPATLDLSPSGDVGEYKGPVRLPAGQAHALFVFDPIAVGDGA